MTNENGRPVEDGAARRPGGPDTSVPERSDVEALNALSTPDLKKLISKLEAGYSAACELTDALAEYDELITAAATARRVLKVRLARERINEARQMLNDLGRTA